MVNSISTFFISNWGVISASLRVSYIRDVLRFIVSWFLILITKHFKMDKAPEFYPLLVPKPSIEHKAFKKEIKIGCLTISISTSSYIFRSL